MDNLYKFYQEFCHNQVQTGQYEYFKWLQWYKPVPQQLRTPSIIQQELNSAADSEKPIKCEKKNKDTASNKRTRESWNYTQTAKLVKLWNENINLIESSRCNEVWFTIRKELSKYGGQKTKKQCTDKLRNLKDLYKKAKENNRTSGASPETSLFFEDFDEILGSRDVSNMPELKEVGAAEKSSFNLFDEMESTSTCSNSETSADDTTGNPSEVFTILSD